MLRWWSPKRQKTNRSPVKRPRILLQLEALETRDCPSTLPTTPLPGTDSTTATAPAASSSTTAPAPVTNPSTSLTVSAAPGPNRTVTVTGQVSGNAPAGLTVTLSGVVSASVTTNANGAFTWTGPASALGQIQATVTDSSGDTVAAFTTLTDPPPAILNFKAINNGYNSWTFTGQVQDASAAGLVVQLGGIPSLNNGNASATVQANGTFSYTVLLQPGEQGGVTALCSDSWGQSSNQATAYVSN
jgi:hypothetical protein